MGNLSRRDDDSIPDVEDLYRRIVQEWLVPDAATGRKRLSSMAFKSKDNEISVSLASLTDADNCFSLGGPKTVGVAAVTAGGARQLEQAVVRDPTPAEPAHALICGKQTKRVLRALAKKAVWMYPASGMPGA